MHGTLTSQSIIDNTLWFSVPIEHGGLSLPDTRQNAVNIDLPLPDITCNTQSTVSNVLPLPDTRQNTVNVDLPLPDITCNTQSTVNNVLPLPGIPDKIQSTLIYHYTIQHAIRNQQ